MRVWPESSSILPAAFADAGVEIVRIRPHSVEPSGGGFLYGYEVDTVDEHGVVATVLTYIDTDPRPDEVGSSLAVENPAGGPPYRVWAYPSDPSLPALADVTYPDRVTELLAGCGVVVASPDLAVVAYRPTKRAVIRVADASTTVFLKVVRPYRVEPIAALHASFVEAGLPVPRVISVRDSGVLVLERAPGVAAGTRVVDIAAGGGFVDSVLEIMTRVAEVGITGLAQADALDNQEWHRAGLGESMPDRGDDISDVYDEIDRRRREWESDTRVVIHGDLHLEQLFVDEGDPSRITGLLDIDTAGWGHPARDPAALVAHLVVTAQWHRGNGDARPATACERLADEMAQTWAERNPHIASRLAPSIASQLLAHAGGQASLGTDSGRVKAVQLLDAAIGTLWGSEQERRDRWGPVDESCERDAEQTPTVTLT